MEQNINKLNSVFGQLEHFREAFNLFDFFIQSHVIHLNSILKGTWSALNTFHVHRTYEFSILLRGKMKYELDKQTIELDAGDAVIIPPGSAHCWYAVENSLIFSIMIFISRYGEDAREDIQNFNKSIADHNYMIRNFKEFEENAKKMISEAEKQEIGYDSKILCLSREAYIEMMRKLAPRLSSYHHVSNMPPKRGDTSTSIVELVRYYVQDNIFRPIKMREISAHLGISVNRMNQIFKAECGQTVWSYIFSYKIEYCCDLLHSTDHPVKSIAALVGFDDVSYFCRAFKKHTGLTPMQFRKKCLVNISASRSSPSVQRSKKRRLTNF